MLHTCREHNYYLGADPTDALCSSERYECEYYYYYFMILPWKFIKIGIIKKTAHNTLIINNNYPSTVCE